MSQYPSPYDPPNFQPQHLTYGGPPDVLAPARRASLMMFIIGPLLLLCGGGIMSMPLMFSMVPSDKLQPMLDQIQDAYNYPARVVFPVLGAIILLPGVALLTLAFFVRRGGRISAVLASVLVGLVLLKSVVELALSLLHAGDPNAVGAMCLDLFSLGIFGTLMLWLIQAIRAFSTVKQAQQQYLAQYWQYQQAMQAHSGYGYAAPPQEGQMYAPPTPPPPPTPPSSFAPPVLPPTEPGDSSGPPPTGGPSEPMV